MQKILDPTPLAYSEGECYPLYNIAQSFELPREFHIPDIDLVECIQQRKTRRTFKKPTLQDLSSLLWFSARTTTRISNSVSSVRLPYPSAGGLGGIQIIFVNSELPVWRYNRDIHCAEVLFCSAGTAEKIIYEAEEFMDVGDASIALFFADHRHVGQFYDKPESLMLREAGGLQVTMGLVCEALNMAFCSLGTQGLNWTAESLCLPRNLIIPGGVALIGNQ